MKIAVVGTGRMGQALAGRLLDAGHDVQIWNRTAGKAPALVARGAQEASSVAEAAAGADVALTSLANDAAVEAVVLAPGGLLDVLAPSAVHVDASTLSPDLTARLAAARSPEVFVAMPVLGNPDATAAGQATLLLGGEAATLERLRPVFAALAATTRDCGPAPLATVHKLVSNLLLVTGVAALAEAITVARSGGVSPDALRSFLEASPMLAPGLANRLGDALDGPHDGWWSPRLAAKDARLAASVASSRSEVDLPLAQLVATLYERTAEQVGEDKDMAAVVELYRSHV